MGRRIIALVAVIVVALSIAATSVAAQDGRSVYWNRWDVRIDNVDTAANRFDVTEIYNVAFSGTFRFGSRVIPLDRLDSIENIAISIGGEPLAANCSGQPGTFCAENTGEGRSITYYFFSPVTNATLDIDIAYTVSGALRVYEGGDQLWWSAIPKEHYGFPIGSSTITVHLPPGFAPRQGIDPVVTYGAPADVQVSGTTITAKALRQLGGNDELEIRVQYPHDPNAAAPRWQSGFDAQRAFEENVQPIVNIIVALVLLALVVGGPLVIFSLWHSKGRDPKVGVVPEYLSEPPSDLPPAIVGSLVDEVVDLRDVMSTLIDLANRGFLVIEEEKKEGLFGIGGSSAFTFKRTDKPLDGLRGYEKRMMDEIFGGNRMERSLDTLRNTFYVTIGQMQSDLYEELVKEGLFASNPNTTRARWSGCGALLFGLAFVAIFFGAGATGFSPLLMFIPFIVGFNGVLLMIVGRHMAAKTRKGAEEAAKWRAFEEYLRNLEKYDDVQESAKHFSDYLPYAVAFGLDKSWVRKFSSLNDVSIPIWYYPTYLGPYRGGYHAGTSLGGRGVEPGGGGLPGDLARAGGDGMSLDNVSRGLAGGLENISSGLSSMLDSASRVMTSRPQSASSGSSGHWGGGGSSFSGGGFSGGGSSGGGSSGFG